MRHFFATLSALAIVLSVSAGAYAQPAPATTASALGALFSAPINREVFSPSVNPTPANIANVDVTVKGLVLALGPLAKTTLVNETPDGSVFSLAFQRGTADATIALDAQGKITSIYFRDAEGPALAAALGRVLRADKAEPGWFSDTFLQHVSQSQLDVTLRQLHAQYGAFQSLQPGPSGYMAVFEKGRLAAQIMFGADGKINVLQLHPAA